MLADARAEARRIAVEAGSAAEQVRASADHLVDEAERALETAHADIALRLAEVTAAEQRAAEDAALVRRLAADEAAAARLNARDEIMRMLATAREERRRTDAEAAAVRERLDREAAARYVSLVAEVQALEHRRDLLRAETDPLSGPASAPERERLDVRMRRFLDRLHLGPRSLRAP